jgi:hypothetical protein
MPELITGDAVGYVASPLVAELDELAAWFVNAAEILAAIVSEAPPPPTPPTPAPWCWPELFHLAVLLPLHPHEPSRGSMLRAGFSVGDGGNDQPYFYVTPHDTVATPPSASVLTAASLLAERQPAEAAQDRLRAAVGALRKTAAK